MAEVGVASSMAAGALTACMGGTPSQIMQAAEIGIEQCVFPPRSCLPTVELRLRLTRFMWQTRSSLGLTCDPIDGLVQVPCIERYAAKHPTFWIRQTHRRRRKLKQILILRRCIQELSRRRQSRDRCVSSPFHSGILFCETRKRRDADPFTGFANQRTAAQLALAGEGIHSVSLDDAIEAMRLTARDMHSAYKVR